jgi:type VI secretion system secreted protein VgrG
MSRVIEIITPLEKDLLLFHTMHGTEEMSRLFAYELVLLSKNGEVPFDDVVGKSMTVALERADEGVRYFNGICSRFSQGGRQGGFHVYRATLRPWLWVLTRTTNCRIFQEKSVPDVLKEIFSFHSISDVKFELTDSYSAWEYCVQYNESDWAFVSRLMEKEGIYYFFKHEEGRHTLVVADSPSAYTAAYGEEIPFIAPEERVRPEKEHVYSWEKTQEMRSGKVSLTTHDFEKPSVDLEVRSDMSGQYALADYEIFEYGGDYVERGDGELYARTRNEEEQQQHDRARGATNARALAPGYLFTLGSHKRADQNGDYLVISASYELKSGEHEGRDDTAASYACTFTALTTKQPFRAPSLTEKPIVHGPQTAVVVGPSGEEIHTDKYGRVKVHFFWDRYGKQDDTSSCWIRVSHPWAGKNWGMVTIPRIGHEVIVEFLGGDPDRPIITGSVYNAELMPPFELPGNKTQTGVRTRSSMGGTPANCNEIRFEDKKGSEQVFIHAEKNQDSEVENDETHWVGNNRKKTVDNDETTKIGNNRTEDVGANEKITIGANRTEKVSVNEDITIGANRTEKVGANENITIGANQTITVGAARNDTVGATMTQTIAGTLTQTVGGGITITTPGPFLVTAAGGYTVIAPGGTKVIDESIIAMGGKYLFQYSLKFGIQALKIDTSMSIALSAQPLKVDRSGTKIDNVGTEAKKAQISAKQIGADVELGDLKMFSKSVNLFL